MGNAVQCWKPETPESLRQRQVSEEYGINVDAAYFTHEKNAHPANVLVRVASACEWQPHDVDLSEIALLLKLRLYEDPPESFPQLPPPALLRVQFGGKEIANTETFSEHGVEEGAQLSIVFDPGIQFTLVVIARSCDPGVENNGMKQTEYGSLLAWPSERLCDCLARVKQRSLSEDVCRRLRGHCMLVEPDGKLTPIDENAICGEVLNAGARLQLKESQLICRQDAEAGGFFRPEALRDLTVGDSPDSPLYLNLDVDWNQWRGADGQLKFRVVWPTLIEDTGDRSLKQNHMEWSQTSTPMEQIQGYRAIDVPYPGDRMVRSNAMFGGVMCRGRYVQNGSCILHGNAGGGNWWWCFGACHPTRAGNPLGRRNLFPGPIANGRVQAVRRVELWLV